MRSSTALAAAAALALLLPASLLAQEPDTRPGFAVFPFENGGSLGPDREDVEALAVGVQQMLLTELAQSSDLRIVERSRIRDILAEIDLGVSGRVEPGTAAEIGRVVGARYSVTGVFMDLYGTFRMDARVVNVETSEILKTEQVRGRKDQIYDLLLEMAGKLMTGVELPPLPAATLDARRNREIPAEAVTLYSRALVFQDAGQTEEAIEVFRRIVTRFPEMTEAREALDQLSGV